MDVHDIISDQLVELHGLLSRLHSNLSGAPSRPHAIVPALREVYMRILCEILKFFGVMTKYAKRRSFSS
jgi:hypothetical protein